MRDVIVPKRHMLSVLQIVQPDGRTKQRSVQSFPIHCRECTSRRHETRWAAAIIKSSNCFLYRVLKLLSEAPANYKDAPREGIRRVLEEVAGRPHPRDQPLDTSRIASIRMGTTVSSSPSNILYRNATLVLFD